MSGFAAAFAREAPGVTAAESEREGEFVHVYSGALADREESVRFLTLAPGIDDEDATEAFRRTAGAWENAAAHPNIVAVSDRGDEPRPWIAVPDVSGQPLDAAQSALAPAETKPVVADVAEALRHAALYNMSHLALRPDRVWVLPGEDGVTGLVDEWGLERAVRNAAGDPDVTPFTAPEAVGDPGAGDEQTDVYGLGALAYFALTGQPPISAGTDLAEAITAGEITPPSAVDESISPAVEEVVMEALATAPGDRPESAYAFKQAFEQAFPPADRESGTGGVSATDSGQADEQDGPADESGQADEQVEANDDSSVSRRAALGMLGVGGVAAGGGWLATQMDGDGDERAPPARTETPTDPSAGTPTPSGTVVFDEGFEDGEYADTFEIRRQQSDTSIDVTGENPRNGERSLAIRVGTSGQGDIAIQRAFSQTDTTLTYAAWIYPNSEAHNVHFNFSGATGSADISFNAAQHIIYRTDREIDESNRDYFGNPILHENPEVDRWYRTSITAYLSRQEVDFEVRDAAGNRWRETAVPATTDFERVRIGGTDYHGNYTFYVDDVVLRSE